MNNDIEHMRELRYELGKIFPNCPTGIRGREGKANNGFCFAIYKDKELSDPETFKDIPLEYVGEIGLIYAATAS